MSTQSIIQQFNQTPKLILYAPTNIYVKKQISSVTYMTSICKKTNNKFSNIYYILCPQKCLCVDDGDAWMRKIDETVSKQGVFMRNKRMAAEDRQVC